MASAPAWSAARPRTQGGRRGWGCDVHSVPGELGREAAAHKGRRLGGDAAGLARTGEECLDRFHVGLGGHLGELGGVLDLHTARDHASQPARQRQSAHAVRWVLPVHSPRPRAVGNNVRGTVQTAAVHCPAETHPSPEQQRRHSSADHQNPSPHHSVALGAAAQATCGARPPGTETSAGSPGRCRNPEKLCRRGAPRRRERK
eukprot:scaffold10647_cov113-Isochrysis_galbana.AAC.14